MFDFLVWQVMFSLINNGYDLGFMLGDQWRFQEFCSVYSYFTLKKFRVISVYFKCFGTFR